MAAAFDAQADWALLARPVSDEVFAQVARERWPACLREIERLTRDLESLRSVLRPAARLSPTAAARLELDLAIYQLEQMVLDAVIERRAIDPLLIDQLRSARERAEQIGGGS